MRCIRSHKQPEYISMTIARRKENIVSEQTGSPFFCSTEKGKNFRSPDTTRHSMLNHFGIYRHHEVYHGYSVQSSLFPPLLQIDINGTYRLKLQCIPTALKTIVRSVYLLFRQLQQHTHNVYIQIEPGNIYFEAFS